jgi:hypothetical protein
MEGPPPLGYDVENRQLVINETEAETVRSIYKLYLRCDGVRDLKEDLDRQGIRSKTRSYANGKTVGGVPLSRGMLYRLLSNPVYIGRVSHKDKTYDGQHDGIIPHDIWDAVQRKLTDNRANRTSRTNASHPSLLAGLLYDETGDRLTPTHANNHGKRYRFYISHRLTMQRRSRIEGWRLPAFELEKAVLSGLAESLRDPEALVDLARLDGADAAMIETFTFNAGEIAVQLQASGTEKTLQLLQQVISRIEIRPGNLRLVFCRKALISVLRGDKETPRAVDDADITTIDLPFHMRRRGVEAKLMLAGKTPSKPSQDATIIQLIRDVHRWLDSLTSGKVYSIDDLASHEGIPASEISRTLQLAFLAPDITKSILLGTQPVDLTAQSLKRPGKLPGCWQEQRRLLGMQG